MAISNLVILDAGHNEYVAGKQAPDGSMKEWEFNNDMQFKIKKRCEDHGLHVYLTNPESAGKDEIGLDKRCQLANTYYKNNNRPKTMFISIHSNAHISDWSDARGTETYVASNASETSKSFGKNVNNNVVAAIKKIDPNGKDRGLKVKDFYVIKNTITPCCLVEYAFYTNREDLVILKNNRNELAEATVKSLCEYFGVIYKPVDVDNQPIPPKPTPPIVNEKITKFYKLIAGEYTDREKSLSILKELQSEEYSSFIDPVTKDGIIYYRVVVSTYTNRSQAYAELNKIIKKYYDSFITIYRKGV